MNIFVQKLTAKTAYLSLLALTMVAVNCLPSYAGPGFAFRHPRRAEVLGRDGRINNVINKDYGKLGGNFGALKAQDQSIRQQEQMDAKANGGFITKAQKSQLNQEETNLRQEVRQDYQ